MSDTLAGFTPLETNRIYSDGIPAIRMTKSVKFYLNHPTRKMLATQRVKVLVNDQTKTFALQRSDDTGLLISW